MASSGSACQVTMWIFSERSRASILHKQTFGQVSACRKLSSLPCRPCQWILLVQWAFVVCTLRLQKSSAPQVLTCCPAMACRVWTIQCPSRIPCRLSGCVGGRA